MSVETQALIEQNKAIKAIINASKAQTKLILNMEGRIEKLENELKT